ncbi:MAG TPA: hypothetical protein ENG80_02435, partial [Nitrospirae bacterium]|nr:hypothetical protein [Nitrospirota bacterium]
HLILMALIEGLRPEEREKVLRRLSVPKKAREEMLESIEQFKKTLSRLQATSWQEKDIYYALHPLSLQSVLFTIAKARDKKQKKALSSYLTTLRKIKPSLTGKDLKTLGYAPGPLFNKILRAVLDERLNGKVKSREEEMEFVKKEFPV